MNLTTRTPRSGVVWSGASSVRVRPWPHDPGRAFLLISGYHGPDLVLPTPDILRQWLETISSWGYNSVRTTALAPAPADALREVGFITAQDLVLLGRHHIGRVQRDWPHDIAPRPVRRRPTGRYSPRVINDILRLDRDAFGDEWCLDDVALRDAFSATKRSRLFVSRNRGELEGFVLVGATQRNGFIQRLAVTPHARRTGVATRLVARALHWTQTAGCTNTVVNTERTNTAALGVYASFDFEELPHGLVVLERAL